MVGQSEGGHARPTRAVCARGAGRTRRKQMQLRSALLAATIVAMPIVASAQPVTGLYVGAGVGVNVETKESVKNLSFPVLAPLGSGLSTSGNVGGSTGFAGEVSLGWGF